jgi:hypothetical protein
MKMTAEMNKVFTTCNLQTLPEKTTHLIEYATHLVSDHADGAFASATLASTHGASVEELTRVACLAACTAGPKVAALHVQVARKVSALAKAAEGVKPAASLEQGTFHACSSKSLDAKTTHLVGLAACLARSCECAKGHIVQARLAHATEAELARVACIASCSGGLSVKYAFLAYRHDVGHCKTCVCS